MRLKNLWIWDIKFQIKYGFYLLYTALTMIYLVVIFALPMEWRERIVTILVFSDPAAMGLFFMGAIVLLEKSQRVPCALAVSPVRTIEYILSKVGALSLISAIVAVILSLTVAHRNLIVVIIGTLFSETIFSLLGIIVATKITSLNQFLIGTVPIEIIAFIPSILHLFGVTPNWLKLYPANICIDMVAGKVPSMMGLLVVIAVIMILMFVANRLVNKMWSKMGGAKL